jgi:hypothetical protein
MLTLNKSQATFSNAEFITSTFSSAQPNTAPLQKYEYTLKLIDQKIVQIYLHASETAENKELICESELAGKFRITNETKSVGNRFFFVLQNLEAKKKHLDKELYCYGLREGWVSFIANKIGRIDFTQNYALIYNTEVSYERVQQPYCIRETPNLTVFNLASMIMNKGPYPYVNPITKEIIGKGPYPYLVPVLSKHVTFEQNSEVWLNEVHKRVEIIKSNGKNQFIDLDEIDY